MTVVHPSNIADPVQGQEYDLCHYVVVEHLRKTGVEFDVYQSALDVLTLEYRIHLALYELLRRNGVAHEHVDDGIDIHDFVHEMLEVHILKSIGHHRVLYVSICDRTRIIDALTKLEGDMFNAVYLELASVEFKRTHTDDEIDAAKRAKEDIRALVTGLIGKGVLTLEALAPVKITQGTAEGQTPEIRIFDPAVMGAEKLLLSECAITEAGVRIEAMGGSETPANKVLKLTNGLTGYKVVLTGSNVTTEISPGNSYEMTEGALSQAWTITVEAIPETEEDEDGEE